VKRDLFKTATDRASLISGALTRVKQDIQCHTHTVRTRTDSHRHRPHTASTARRRRLTMGVLMNDGRTRPEPQKQVNVDRRTSDYNVRRCPRAAVWRVISECINVMGMKTRQATGRRTDGHRTFALRFPHR